MTIGSYYKIDRLSLGNNPSPNSMLSYARNQLEQNVYDDEAFINLQNFLTNLFYPKNNNNNNNSYWEQQIDDLIDQRIKKNIDDASASVSPQIVDSLQLFFNTPIQTTGKPTWTSQSRLEQIQALVKRLLSTLDIKTHATLISQLQEMAKDVNIMLSQCSVTVNNRLYLDYSADPNSLYSKLFQMRYLLDVIPQVQNISDISGKVFEEIFSKAIPTQAVVATGFNIIRNSISQGLGQQTMSEGRMSIEMSSLLEATKQNFSNSKKFKIQNVEVDVNSVFNPYSSRMGKTDVSFSYGYKENSSNMGQFNASLKAWRTGKMRDFGETNLAYALIRGASESFLAQYVYVMQDKYNIGLQATYHHMGKIAIALDILLGISQKNNMANIIIIDTGHSIILHSYKEILNKLINPEVKISGYNGNSISQGLIELRRKATQRTNYRSEYYEGLAYYYLQTKKVTVFYNSFFNSK